VTEMEGFNIRDRIKRFERVPAGSILPNPKNPRVHNGAQRAAVRDLLQQVGMADVLLVRQTADGKYLLVDGHLRRELFGKAHLVPVVVLDLNDEEADLMTLTLDSSAGMAEWNQSLCQALIETVSTSSDAIDGLLRRVMGEAARQPCERQLVEQDEVPIDRAAELRQKWQTAYGQTWQIGDSRLYCGDCRQLPADFFGGKKVRLLWTDAPYGVSYADKNELLNRSDRGNRIQKPIVNDHLTPAETEALFVSALAAAVPHCELGAAIYATAPAGPLLARFMHGLEAGGFTLKQTLVWIKNHFVLGMSQYHYRHEPIIHGWLEPGAHIWNGGRSQDSVFEIAKPAVSELHPTTKPVELVARMIANSSRPGDLVYDPFAGSGTTLVAAHQLGRVGYGVEIDPAYAAVILERLANLSLRPTLASEQ
jgi:DNA modification methylase